MTTLIAPCLFTEASLNVEPTVPGSTLHIPTENSSLFSPRKRLRLDDDVEQDDGSYARKHLATESSIFFRRKSREPRSFLWRVLDDRKLLEIQCVDLVQGGHSRSESVLTYALSFSSAIRPNGIAFADPDEHDTLEVFVLTSSNELFTFSLRKDLLTKSTVPASSDFDPSNCFKTLTLGSFKAKQIYKLVALSSLELMISLNDGGLLHLSRKAGDNGSIWRETYFVAGGWTSSLRGMIAWKGHNTQRFNSIDLEPSSAAAMEASPDGEHLYTVSLDHTLKAWNMQTGKVGVQVDILGEAQKDPNLEAQSLINPSPGTLMRVHEVKGQPDGDKHYVVTYSPKGHQFKFWAIRDADSAQHGIRDVRPDITFLPPLDELMNTNVWQLADFHVKPGSGWRDSELWVRARSGALCRTFTLTFDLLASRDDLEDAWRNKWSVVDEGSLSVHRLISSAQFPQQLEGHHLSITPSLSTDRWINFLFYPGRFSASTLETALYIYRKGLNILSTSRSADARKPLKERLCSAINAKITVRRGSSGQPDLSRYNTDVYAQWNVFFGLVRHLHEQRMESLSLAFDAESNMAWSVRAGQVAPVRTCSEAEILHLNETTFTSQDEEWIVNSLPLADSLFDEASVQVARLLAAARSFRANLSPIFNYTFDEVSSINTLKDVDETAGTRSKDQISHALHDLYDRCGLGGEVSDEDFNRLADSAQDLGGLGELENDLFFAALDRLTESSRGQSGQQALTHYGDRVTIRGAQETLLLGRAILLDLLALVVFMSQDLEPEELAPGFKAVELYPAIIARLKEYNVLVWLSANMRQETPRISKSSMSDASQLSKASPQPTLTLLESIFIGDWPSLSLPDEPISALITYWCRAWTFGPNLATAYDGVTAHILGNLLISGDYRMAASFSQFVPDNSWTKYLRARLYLAEGEYDYASAYFEQAAHDLSQKAIVKIEALDTSALLTPAARLYLADGLPRYYLHVVALFESAKLISYAADFATLALRELDSENEEDADTSIADLDRRKGSSRDTPAAMQIDLAMEEVRLLRVQDLREEILGRLFHASLQTARYQDAFEALVKFGNPVIRKASLQSLLQSLLTTASTPTLLSLDFPSELFPDVDAILLSLSRKQLAASPGSITPSSRPQYTAILYAWRIRNDDFRGAAEVLWTQLQRLKADPTSSSPRDDRLLDAYLTLINTLACCGDAEGWILAETGTAAADALNASARKTAKSGQDDDARSHQARRRIVTLEDVRREYQAELDRRSEMVQGRFALVAAGGDGMDVL